MPSPTVALRISVIIVRNRGSSVRTVTIGPILVSTRCDDDASVRAPALVVFFDRCHLGALRSPPRGTSLSSLMPSSRSLESCLHRCEGRLETGAAAWASLELRLVVVSRPMPTPTLPLDFCLTAALALRAADADVSSLWKPPTLPSASSWRGPRPRNQSDQLPSVKSEQWSTKPWGNGHAKRRLEPEPEPPPMLLPLQEKFAL